MTFSSFIFENLFDFQLVLLHDCFKFNFNNPKNGFDSNRPSYRPVVRDSCRPVQRFVTTVMSYSSHWISLLATEYYAVSHTSKSLFSYFTTRRRAVLCQNAQESITRIARAHNATRTRMQNIIRYRFTRKRGTKGETRSPSSGLQGRIRSGPKLRSDFVVELYCIKQTYEYTDTIFPRRRYRWFSTVFESSPRLFIRLFCFYNATFSTKKIIK